MLNIKKTISKTVAILMAAATIATTGIISAGAYATYGSSTTAYASKSGYNFYEYGVSNRSHTEILRSSGKNRFVISQIIILKKDNNGKYNDVESSKSNPGTIDVGYGRGVWKAQSTSYRRYWHRGVLNKDTSYDSGTYHVFKYNKKF